MAELEQFDSPNLYDVTHVGSFGRFNSGNSFPIEYLMTTFSMTELLELSFARDIKPDSLDFDLLIQRDIDEDRVKNEIEPYLNPVNSSVEEISTRAVFFPPLLVAIVPTNNRVMGNYYPDETGSIGKQIIREWEGVFKMTFFPGVGERTYSVEVMQGESVKKVSVKRDPVKLETRRVRGIEPGASLVVIDGQHRLFALRKLYETKPEFVTDLVVPVCMIFSPKSTKAVQNNSGNVETPTVPHIFRHLFVDVNTTMELVGGHFNILLSDSTIGSLVCREFCAYVLLNRGKEGLSVIEWNTKKKKESTIIKRGYSLTSIGVIDLALQEVFKKQARVNYVLNLNAVSEELYPEGNEEGKNSKVVWDKFSLTQKKIIEKQVKKYLVPCLDKIFFKTNVFSTAYEIFENELNLLKNKITSENTSSIENQMALEYILDYIPIKSDKNHLSQIVIRDFENTIKNSRSEATLTIVQYAIFQRGIFYAWGDLLDYTKEKSIDPKIATDAYVWLLDEALSGQGKAFSQTKKYIQHSIFLADKIKPKKGTALAVGNLIISFLGNKSKCKDFVEKLNLNNTEQDSILKQLINFGQNSAGKFRVYYEKERIATFKQTYKVDLLGLTRDERDELSDLEATYKSHVQEVRDGTRRKEEVSQKFDLAVNKYLQDDYNLAMNELKLVLGYSTDIIGNGDAQDSNEE